MKLLDISTPKRPNLFTMVDDEDYDWLNQWKWYPCRDRDGLYALRSKRDYVAKTHTQIYLHRVLMKAPPGSLVDHKDGNPLNNQKENLRFCTPLQNSQNCSKRSGTTSRFKGVHFCSRDKRWRASIRANSKKIYIGQYTDEVKAAIAYNDAAVKYYGEFARLNEIPLTEVMP